MGPRVSSRPFPTGDERDRHVEVAAEDLLPDARLLAQLLNVAGAQVLDHGEAHDIELAHRGLVDGADAAKALGRLMYRLGNAALMFSASHARPLFSQSPNCCHGTSSQYRLAAPEGD